jgi:hypothetical protein
MLIPLRIAMIPEAGREPGDDPRALLDLAQQQSARVRGDCSSVKLAHHLTSIQRMKFEALFGYTVSAKGCHPSPAQVFLAKLLMPERDSLLQFFSEKCGLMLRESFGRFMSRHTGSGPCFSNTYADGSPRKFHHRW